MVKSRRPIRNVRLPVPPAAPRPEGEQKTLVFCTGWADSPGRWDELYGRWLGAIRSRRLRYHQILIPDDGSPTLPGFSDCEVIAELPPEQPASECVIYHFRDHLGTVSVGSVYPGWYRSYALAAVYADRYGFQKVVHVESDAFLISRRMHEFVNDRYYGWTAMWCPLHGFPESAIQVIAGDSMKDYLRLAATPYDAVRGRIAEFFTPFTHVERGFKGDRYAERGRDIPRDADYANQVVVPTHCWWLDI